MTWSVEGRTVAEARINKVRAERALGGARLFLDVEFRLSEWPGFSEQPPRALHLVLQAARVALGVRQRLVSAGIAVPLGTPTLSPASNSSAATVAFDLFLTRPALAELEETRANADIEVEMELQAIGLTSRGAHPMTARVISMEVARQDWLELLSSSGFCDALLFEVPLPALASGELMEAERQLLAALERRNSASSAECVAEARKVFDALKRQGFGGRCPQEVAQFLQQKARQLTMEERYSALLIALKLYTSPAHHHTGSDELTRADADLALSLAAAMVRTAPLRGGRKVDDSTCDDSQEV